MTSAPSESMQDSVHIGADMNGNDDYNFHSTSSDKPTLLTISFESNPKANLGAQLVNCDKYIESQNFLPGYAVVGRVLDGEGHVAKEQGVRVGDCIVAVNGQGFRRFAPDYDSDQVEHLNAEKSKGVELDHRVVPAGSAYDDFLQRVKTVKKAGADPLVLSLERYGWDARPNAWGRFLLARDNNVPEAMQMLQNHEAWRLMTFPLPLKTVGLQRILREKVVSEIDIDESSEASSHVSSHPLQRTPTVYVNYGRLLTMEGQGQITAEDVIQAFCVFTERMLSKSKDPRHPKACQFIDMANVSITGSGVRVDLLKKIYAVFEPNYPETLDKMVLYPVSTIMASTAKTMLSFIKEKTQKKFVLTSSLEKVCDELGWNKREVEAVGGVTQFMHKHEKAGTSMIFYDDQIADTPDVKVEDLSANEEEDGEDGEVKEASKKDDDDDKKEKDKKDKDKDKKEDKDKDKKEDKDKDKKEDDKKEDGDDKKKEEDDKDKDDKEDDEFHDAPAE